MLIMACDVALGEEFETKRDKYMETAQPGTQCTHALGKFAPVESGMVDDGTGCMMPLGNEIQTAAFPYQQTESFCLDDF